MTTQTRAPTSDEAASGTWTGSAGTRYQSVDDHPDSAGTDILTAGTAASAITFGFSAFTVPAGATINSVAINYYDSKSASQGVTVAGRLKVGGSYFNHATTHNAATSYTLRTDTFTQNPATAAAWTVDQVNGTAGANQLQAFGINASDASPTVRLASIEIVVDYTEAVPGRPPGILTPGRIAAFYPYWRE